MSAQHLVPNPEKYQDHFRRTPNQNDRQNINGFFVTAFNTRNASGGGQGWTSLDGGDPGGTFEVTIARALQFEADNSISTDGTVGKGGLEI